MSESIWWATPVDRPFAEIRVVCFPHAGGGPAPFVRWARQSPPWLRICPVLLPGRGPRRDEPPLVSVGGIVDGVARALRVVPDLPTVVLGHSFGATLAVALTQRLEAEGRGPLWCVVSGRGPVDRPSRLPPLAHLNGDALLAAVQQETGGIPDVVWQDASIRALAAAQLRADLTASEAWSPASFVLSTPLLACAGTEDALVSVDILCDWKRLTRSAFSWCQFPGSHFSVLDGPHFFPHVQRQLEVLRDALP